MIERGKCYIVAELGINHNGDMAIAKSIIENSKDAGCDAVKFQKRTVNVVYGPEELERPRESPFGQTNADLKWALELDKSEYQQIDDYCRDLGIEWFASPWDEESVDFLVQFDPPYLKIASASATDRDLLVHCARTGRPLLVSTGMCDLAMIRRIVETIRDAGGVIACLYHCVSTYPCADDKLNLSAITTLQNEFADIPIGYSGHEVGIATSVMARVLGAASIERHITLDRAMWGSDHAASIEPQGLARLVRDIRTWEAACGDGNIVIHEDEVPVAAKLRRKNTV